MFKLAVSLTAGAALFTGLTATAAPATPAGPVAVAAICYAVVTVDQAPIRSEPADTAPAVDVFPRGTNLWVRTPPVNRYLNVIPPDLPPPQPGPGRWIREDHVQLRGCPAEG